MCKAQRRNSVSVKQFQDEGQGRVSARRVVGWAYLPNNIINSINKYEIYFQMQVVWGRHVPDSVVYGLELFSI